MNKPVNVKRIVVKHIKLYDWGPPVMDEISSIVEEIVEDEIYSPVDDELAETIRRTFKENA